MRIKRRIYFGAGILFGLFLIGSYFIKINTESGGNYVVRDSLLGIIIFHNVFILLLYILIFVVLIVNGFKRGK